MEKKYLSKIIANDNEGLQMISACCAGAEIKVNDIKYLKKNICLYLINNVNNYFNSIFVNSSTATVVGL